MARAAASAIPSSAMLTTPHIPHMTLTSPHHQGGKAVFAAHHIVSSHALPEMQAGQIPGDSRDRPDKSECIRYYGLSEHPARILNLRSDHMPADLPNCL